MIIKPHRRSLMSGLAAGLCLPGAAFAQAPQQPPPTGTLIAKKDRTARLSTQVSINGQGPFDFVIDTGANRSVISRELAAKLGLPPGEIVHVHGIAGVQDAQTVNVRSFKAGVIEVPLTDIPTLAENDLGCDGFLGIDAFTDRQVTFDFNRNIVLISRTSYNGFTEAYRDLAVVSSDVVVPARQRFGQLTIVDAEAAHRRITCFIDSGAQKTVGNMAMRNAVQAVTGDRGFTPINVIIHGATGQEVPGVVAEVPTMRIGGVHFTSFPVAFSDLHTFELWGLKDQPALMVGIDLMRLFEQISVDFGQKKVLFRLAELMGKSALG
jgi:hypothetical protein